MYQGEPGEDALIALVARASLLPRMVHVGYEYRAEWAGRLIYHSAVSAKTDTVAFGRLYA